ncbi:MAG: hypothetical protein WAU47_07630, partial [Desulfobaccales bacterium]
KIAIECDEFMHENYNNKNEIKREETIEKLLNCKFIHFNPYDENINIKLGKIINMIFAAMHEQDISHFLAEYQRWTERDKERIKSELKAIEDAL